MDTQNITIRFCTVTGKEFISQFDPNSTFYQVKQHLEKEYQLQSEFLKLIHQAKILPDNKLINEINNIDTSIIFIHQSNIRTIRPTNPGPLPSGQLEADLVRINHQSFIGNSNPENTQTPEQEFARPSLARKMKNNDGSTDSNFSYMIKTLSDLGFDPENCKIALHKSKNDLNEAASILLAESSQQTNLTTPYENERDQLQSTFKNLNKYEQESIKSLCKLGFPIEMVTQVFIACDKNQQKALECLQTMK